MASSAILTYTSSLSAAIIAEKDKKQRTGDDANQIVVVHGEGFLYIERAQRHRNTD